MDRSEVQADYLSVIGSEKSSRLTPALVFRSDYTAVSVLAGARTFEGLWQTIRDKSRSGALENRLWELLEDDQVEMFLEVTDGTVEGCNGSH